MKFIVLIAFFVSLCVSASSKKIAELNRVISNLETILEKNPTLETIIRPKVEAKKKERDALLQATGKSRQSEAGDNYIPYPFSSLEEIDLENNDTLNKIIDTAIHKNNLRTEGIGHNEVIYPINGKEPYKGWAKSFYSNGILSGLYFYENGKIILNCDYYESGKRKFQIQKKHHSGENFNVTLWHPNGRKKAEGIMTDEGFEDGLFIGWHENGTKRSERNFTNGKRDGIDIQWHSNGQIERKSTWELGKLTGLSESWYDNSQLKVKGFYKDGNKVGAWTEWHKNGQKKAEVMMVEGKRHGKFIIWLENGLKVIEDEYKFGKKIED